MMEAIVITWRELLIALVLASLVYLLEAWLFSRRRKSAGKPDAVVQLDKDMDALHARVARLEASVQDLRHDLAQRETELRAAAEQAAKEQEAAQRLTPYAQAVQLARQGVGPQELAHRCGITNGEAELIVALNRGES